MWTHNYDNTKYEIVDWHHVFLLNDIMANLHRRANIRLDFANIRCKIDETGHAGSLTNCYRYRTSFDFLIICFALISPICCDRTLVHIYTPCTHSCDISQVGYCMNYAI